MLCPYCNHDESNVLESRDALDGKATRRRRECVRCNKRFTTYEKVENIELRVLKKNGQTEGYSREKLAKCLDKACWKMNEDERLRILEEIEMKLLNWPTVEIPSQQIGELVMERLKEKDPVAYIRFATVFLNIKDINDFKLLISKFEP